MESEARLVAPLTAPRRRRTGRVVLRRVHLLELFEPVLLRGVASHEIFLRMPHPRPSLRRSARRDRYSGESNHSRIRLIFLRSASPSPTNSIPAWKSFAFCPPCSHQRTTPEASRTSTHPSTSTRT